MNWFEKYKDVEGMYDFCMIITDYWTTEYGKTYYECVQSFLKSEMILDVAYTTDGNDAEIQYRFNFNNFNEELLVDGVVIQSNYCMLENLKDKENITAEDFFKEFMYEGCGLEYYNIMNIDEKKLNEAGFIYDDDYNIYRKES